MSEPRIQRPWLGTTLYIGLMLLIIFARLVPISAVPITWPRPDYMAVLTLAIAARRPNIVPVWSIAGLFIIADFLLQRPPGLWAFCMLVASETIRARSNSLRAMSFWNDWANVAAVLLLAFAAQRIIAALMFLPLPPLLPYIVMAVNTAAIYPAATFLLSAGFGIRRLPPGELDYRGRRI